MSEAKTLTFDDLEVGRWYWFRTVDSDGIRCGQAKINEKGELFVEDAKEWFLECEVRDISAVPNQDAHDALVAACRAFSERCPGINHVQDDGLYEVYVPGSVLKQLRTALSLAGKGEG
jgi:hypothetical protein